MCGSTDDSRVFAEKTLDDSTWKDLSFSSRKLPEYLVHRMVECPDCDVVYASPAPHEEVLEQAYRAAPFVSAEESAFAAETYRRLLRTVLARLSGRTNALDVGASDGTFLQALLDEGFENVVGIEPAAASAEAAPESVRSRIRVEPFRRASLEGESFDLVTAFQTLEHVSDPAQAVRDAYELLEVGGAILVVVHNRRALLNRLAGRRSPIFDVEHVQLFSLQSIRELLRRAGFEDIRVAGVTNRYPLRYWFKLAPLPAGLKSSLLARLEHSRIGPLPISLRPGNLVASAWRRAPSDAALPT
ncbi:MAG: class I SAM-dependent methyltransferase [Gaiellaceae bacterium]